MEKLEPSYTVGRNEKFHPLWKTVWQFLKWLNVKQLLTDPTILYLDMYVCTCVCKVAQSCPALCNPIDVACQAPLSMGFPKQGYISFSMGSSWHRDRTLISCVSCIVRRVLYHWATWEALSVCRQSQRKMTSSSNYLEKSRRHFYWEGGRRFSRGKNRLMSVYVSGR